MLNKEVSLRSQYEIKQLQSFLQSLPFFKKYVENNQMDILVNCVRIMRYEFIEKDQPVFQIDTEGDKFYIIFEGKVGIYIRKQVQITDVVNDLLKSNRRKTLLKKINLLRDPQQYTRGRDQCGCILRTGQGGRTGCRYCFRGAGVGEFAAEDGDDNVPGGLPLRGDNKEGLQLGAEDRGGEHEDQVAGAVLLPPVLRRYSGGCVSC